MDKIKLENLISSIKTSVNMSDEKRSKYIKLMIEQFEKDNNYKIKYNGNNYGNNMD